MRVSHETIYQSLYVQTRGALKKELTACLRTGRTRRRSPRHRPGEGRLKDMVSISERPAEAADRAVPGHWEGDLILGKLGRSAIGVLVERRSRYVLLLHLPGGRTAPHVRRALVERMVTLPDQLRRSLTWDQGKEMAQHVRFSIGSSSRPSRRSGTGSGRRIWTTDTFPFGRREDGLTTEARRTLSRLKRDNKRLRVERDILKKAAAWFARESGSIPGGDMRS